MKIVNLHDGGDCISCPECRGDVYDVNDYDMSNDGKYQQPDCQLQECQKCKDTKWCFQERCDDICGRSCQVCIIEENLWFYCEKCKIIFARSHSYAVNGCTSDHYFYKTINEYIDNNGKKVLGQPPWLNEVKNKISKITCSCLGRPVVMIVGSYPASKYPEYYEFNCPGVICCNNVCKKHTSHT
jgi:hypothetical protein